jgi:hypothetical protein
MGDSGFQSVSMYDLSGHMGGDDDPTTEYDEGAIRFGAMDGYTTFCTQAYSTSTGDMTRDLDDPYSYEKKPLHYIPGYTGHLPKNRERFGINYREASAATIAQQKAKGVHHPVTPLDAPPPNYFGTTEIKKFNRSQKFVPADQVAQEEGTAEQQKHTFPHALGPYGVYPTDTSTGAMEYVTTNSRVAPNNKADDPNSLASRIAHRRVARTKRNLNGGLFRPDPYDDSTVDDLAALDPRLKILQTRTEYRSESSSVMQTSAEELFDMRDDGAVYSGADAMQ